MRPNCLCVNWNHSAVVPLKGIDAESNQYRTLICRLDGFLSLKNSHAFSATLPKAHLTQAPTTYIETQISVICYTLPLKFQQWIAFFRIETFSVCGYGVSIPSIFISFCQSNQTDKRVKEHTSEYKAIIDGVCIAIAIYASITIITVMLASTTPSAMFFIVVVVARVKTRRVLHVFVFVLMLRHWLTLNSCF